MPEQMMFQIRNEGKNRFSLYHPGELWVRLYPVHFPLERGSVVQVEGKFWIGQGYGVTEASADGKYRVVDIKSGTRTDLNHLSVTLDKIVEKDVFSGEVVMVLKEEGSY